MVWLSHCCTLFRRFFLLKSGFTNLSAVTVAVIMMTTTSLCFLSQLMTESMSMVGSATTTTMRLIDPDFVLDGNDNNNGKFALRSTILSMIFCSPIVTSRQIFYL